MSVCVKEFLLPFLKNVNYLSNSVCPKLGLESWQLLICLWFPELGHPSADAPVCVSCSQLMHDQRRWVGLPGTWLILSWNTSIDYLRWTAAWVSEPHWLLQLFGPNVDITPQMSLEGVHSPNVPGNPHPTAQDSIPATKGEEGVPAILSGESRGWGHVGWQVCLFGAGRGWVSWPLLWPGAAVLQWLNCSSENSVSYSQCCQPSSGSLQEPDSKSVPVRTAREEMPELLHLRRSVVLVWYDSIENL